MMNRITSHIRTIVQEYWDCLSENSSSNFYDIFQTYGENLWGSTGQSLGHVNVRHLSFVVLCISGRVEAMVPHEGLAAFRRHHVSVLYLLIDRH